MSEWEQPQGDDDGREITARFDSAELVQGWRAFEPRMPRSVPVVKVAARSDMGQVRENNEDKFEFYEPESPELLAARGCLYAVADGVGGAQAGQIASEMVLKALVSGYYNHAAEEAVEALKGAIEAANSRVYSLAQMIPERNGMGSTLTAAVFIEGRVIVGQVGDSRAYLVRDGQIRQVTLDHSLVEEQVRAGVMSRQDADSSPFRNVITRSMGGTNIVVPDFFEEECRPGDVWVLCSDGMSNNVEPNEIASIAGHNAPSEAARQFIELANARGGQDNITVLVLSVRHLLSPDEMSAASHANGFSADNITLRPAPSATAPLDPSALQPVNGNHASTSATPPLEDDRPQKSGWRRLFGK